MSKSLQVNETFLVVEDDADLRDAICESLAGLGCQIVPVSNGEDALAALRDHTCFAIVCDYRMPGMNGLELCRRAKMEFPRLKFLILTGAADKQTVLDGFQVGVDDLLEKPNDLGRLREVAEGFVHKRSQEIAQEQEELKVIRKIFCDEADDILRDIETLIFKLEDSPTQPDVIDVLFRKAHTLKGSAGAFQGTEKISAVTHAYENLLQAIKKKRVVPSQALTQILLQAADIIKVLLKDFVKFKETETNLQPFIEALNRWTEGRAGQQQDRFNNLGTEKVYEGAEWALSVDVFASSVPENVAPVEDEEDGILVSIDKLNSFMELSGELVVLKNAYHATIKHINKLAIPQEQKQRLEEMNQSLDKISEQIQGQIMEIRKVQLKVAFQKFPRIVRQVAQDLQKQVRLEMSGTDLGVDKSIAKALSSSLVHVLRNAADHGIETPQERTAQCKPTSGHIRVLANQVGEKIIITIEDDGAGMDPEKIKRKAIEKGLIDRASSLSMSDGAVFELIFMPGFSTAEKVTNVSGRGVGMDVVRTEVSRLGGTLSVDSKIGKGTKLTLSIPVPKTVLVENTLLAESGGHQIVIPLSSISKIAPIKDLILSKVDGRMTCQHEGTTIPLGDYRCFIESPLPGISYEKNDFSPEALVLVISHKEHFLALVVDKVIDQLEAVVRPFDNVVEKLVGFKGTSLLDSEHVAFVLDAESLLAQAYAG